MIQLKVNAIAKINLGLNIVSKRQDGFHNLETLFYPIHDLYDELIFEESECFSFKNEYCFNNIIVKAINLLEQYLNRNINLNISLNKNIPIGAGLGGGSSDAAFILTAVNKLLQLELNQNTLNEIALELGSDVPFFLNPSPAVGASRGELLTPINYKIDFPILIVNPGIHVSTKDAFANVIPKDSQFNYNKIKDIRVTEYKRYIFNDFEESVFKLHPEIKNIKELMISSGALFALMSGTGSSVYGLFPTLEDAKNCKSSFPESYFSFISKPKR